jgi:hypothetical protein
MKSRLARGTRTDPSPSSSAVGCRGLIRRERDERRRERYFVDDDVWYQSTIASARGIAPGRRDRTAGSQRPRPRHPGRRPPGEHRPLQRLHQREHPPRRGAGPRSPLHENRSELRRHCHAKFRSRIDSRLYGHSQWCPRRPLQLAEPDTTTKDLELPARASRRLSPTHHRHSAPNHKNHAQLPGSSAY